MRKRLLMLGLTTVMALAVCACGASDSGNSEQSEEKATEKVPESGEAEKDDAEEKIFWIEVSSSDEVNICLKDEAVNGLTEDDSGSVADTISVKFSAGGEDILSCNLSAEDISVFLPEGSYQEPGTLQEHYADDTVRWTVKERKIAETLRSCDHIIARYMNYADNSKTRRIFEYDDSVMIAALFGDTDGMTDDRGVKLGFDGNFVYVSVTGKEYIDFIKSGRQELKFGTDNPQAGSPYSIQLWMDEEGKFINLPFIMDYQYEADGVIADSGAGYMTAPKLIWNEQDSEHISLWYYAPGFEEAVRGMDYCFTGSNGEGLFGGESGKISDIVGGYVSYDTPIPEIPSVFPKDKLDDKYFKPLTPNYSVVLVEYPEIPVCTGFKWEWIDEMREYWYQAANIDWTSGTLCLLYSYNQQGDVVQVRGKCIYQNANDAVYTHVGYDDYLPAEEPLNDDEVQSQWIVDTATHSPGYLDHDDNVIYVQNEAARISEVMAEGFNHDWRKIITPAGEVTEGSTDYEADGYYYDSYYQQYIRGKLITRQCRYTSYYTFDLNRIRSE